MHVVVMQRRQRNVQKSVMHVQSCCFAYGVLPSSLPLPSKAPPFRFVPGRCVESN